MKGIMYMWKHFLLINKVGAGLAELVYKHFGLQTLTLHELC